MLEMHSIINIFTVISSQLQLIQLASRYPDLMENAIDKTQHLAEFAKQQSKENFSEHALLGYRKSVMGALRRLADKEPVLKDENTVSDYLDIFENIFRVIDIRVKELHKRWENPDKWERFTVDEFKAEFKSFFHALEKNSNGRYRIIYNIAEQEEKDYLVQFEVTGDKKHTIPLPLLLKDVIRDLVANARKYTPPGGKINVGVSSKNGIIRFVVEDTGYGIPEDELADIIRFGYRGSNVKESVKTMGGGFGLTKAYYITLKFDGRMWIESELKKGTKVTIEIPIPADQQ